MYIYIYIYVCIYTYLYIYIYIYVYVYQDLKPDPKGHPPVSSFQNWRRLGERNPPPKQRTCFECCQTYVWLLFGGRISSPQPAPLLLTTQWPPPPILPKSAISLSLYLSLYVYIYIYVCVPRSAISLSKKKEKYIYIYIYIHIVYTSRFVRVIFAQGPC